MNPDKELKPLSVGTASIGSMNINARISLR